MKTTAVLILSFLQTMPVADDVRGGKNELRQCSWCTMSAASYQLQNNKIPLVLLKKRLHVKYQYSL